MTIPAVPTLTTAPNRSQGDSGYSATADAWAASLGTFNVGMNVSIGQINLVSAEINSNAISASADAAAAAASAAAAEASSNASKWISGGPFTEGQVRWSPITFFTYRCKVDNTGTADPSTDSTNWDPLVPASLEIGDLLTTSRTLSSPEFLRTDDSVYLQSAYPDLFALLGTVVDGTSLSSGVLPSGQGWRGIAYGNGIFVGAAYSGTLTAAFSSTDGITWTARSIHSANWTSCAYGDGLFVMVSLNSTVAASSTDGLTWTSRTISSGNAWEDVSFGNGMFVAISSGTNIASSSPDGINWTGRTLPSSGTWKRVGYGNGLWVAIKSVSGTAYATSTDGITWTARTFPVSVNPQAIAYGNETWVIVTSNSTVLTSTDGLTWTSRTSVISGPVAVSFGDGVFFALGWNVSAKSLDGITWVSTGSAGAVTYGFLAYGGGIFASPGSDVTTVRKFVAFSYDPATEFIIPEVTSVFPSLTYVKATL